MTERHIESLGALAGLVASLTVGVPVLVDHVGGAGDLLVVPAWLWWTCYGGYLAAFVAVDRVPQRVAWASERRVLAVQVVFGAAAFAMAPMLGWTAVLLVVTAVTAAYVVSPRAAVGLIVAHSLLLAVVPAVHGISAADVALGVAVYGALQVFAALMVWSGQRGARARDRLAEANAELRAATALLAESSRADERVRIARELHDLVGHQLTALSLELEVASHRDGDAGREHVRRAHATAKSLLSDVRAAVGELRAHTPPLRAALAALTTDLPRPQVHLDIAEDLELDSERTTALVRCVQEIVTNTMRHADAANLWIEIARGEDGCTRLRARDDGSGAGLVEPGHGLTGLRERIEELGGEVSFDHERGFRVLAEVPAS